MQAIIGILMSKPYVSPILEDRIRLRLLAAEDLPLTLRWRNRDEVRRWFFHADKITSQQHLQWFEQYQERDDDFVFVIEDVRNNYRPVGQVALYHLDREKSIAEFGRLMIGEPDALGKGFARAATVSVLEFGFKQLDLDTIYLDVYSNNKNAISLYRYVGFVENDICDNGVVRMVLIKPP